MESLAVPIPPTNRIAVVSVSLVNETLLTDVAHLESSLAAAKLNFDCSELSHCVMKNQWGENVGWFGEHFEYPVLGTKIQQQFKFLESATPVIDDVSPERAMPGSLITLRGRNLMSSRPVTDRNFYMNEFGFYYQPYAASVTVGTFECQIHSMNESVITCHAVRHSVGCFRILERCSGGSRNGDAQNSIESN